MHDNYNKYSCGQVIQVSIVSQNGCSVYGIYMPYGHSIVALVYGGLCSIAIEYPMSSMTVIEA